MIFDKYPYTNFHEMNDDWVIQTLRAFDQRLDEFVSANSLTYADPLAYDTSTTYPANTVVLYDGVAYVSKRAVPAGLLPTADSNYWLEIFPFGDLIEQIMSESMAVVTQRIDEYIETASAQIAQLEDDVEEAIGNIPASVNAWMDAHPDVTTTVQTGSITFPKLASSLKQVILAGYDESANSTPINKSEFVQGGLNYTNGNETTATNACRTGFMQFNQGIVQMHTVTNYMVRAFRYDKAELFINMPMTAVESEWQAFSVDDEHLYRFVIMRSDSAALSPEDLPDIPVWYYFETPRYAEKIGRYPYMTVGDAEQLVSAERVVNMAPYSFRITCDGRGDVGNHVSETVVGGTINWNQLCNGSSTSVTNGHKYVAHIGGSWSVDISNGTALSTNALTDNVFDITQMFGPAIADHIYTIEQSTPGSGVAFFRKLFPNDYYLSDNAMYSVKTKEHVTVGFNQFDIDHMNSFPGFLDTTNIASSGGRLLVYIPCLPDTQYTISRSRVINNDRFAVACTHEVPAPGVLIYNREQASNVGTVGEKMILHCSTDHQAKYLVIWAYWLSASEALDDLNISFTLNGFRDGDYEPYEKNVYSLAAALTLRGIPKLDNSGKLYYDGDTYESDGKITRYYASRAYQAGDEALPDAITDGSTTVYKLTTPEVTYVAPFINPQLVNNYGTEEYVDYDVEAGSRDVAVPVGHVSVYHLNLRDKIETMPNLPDSDGAYVLVRQNGQFSYMLINI